MKSSKLPLDCKIAKLKLLYKKGSKTDPKNYRPVSLLSLVSKVIEKVIHNHIHNILKKCIGFSEKLISWFESHLSGR